MNRKIALIGLALLLSAVATGASVALQQSKTPLNSLYRAEQSTLIPASEIIIQPTAQPTPKEYRDPSGFLFSYPASYKLTAAIDESDPDLYALITVKSDQTDEVIILRITASPYTRPDQWLRENNLTKTSDTVMRTTLGGLSAYEAKLPNARVTAAIDTGVIITLTAPPKPSKENLDAYSLIAKTFAFYRPDSVQPRSAPSRGETIIVEEDEVIQ